MLLLPVKNIVVFNSLIILSSTVVTASEDFNAAFKIGKAVPQQFAPIEIDFAISIPVLIPPVAIIGPEKAEFTSRIDAAVGIPQLKYWFEKFFCSSSFIL